LVKQTTSQKKKSHNHKHYSSKNNNMKQKTIKQILVAIIFIAMTTNIKAQTNIDSLNWQLRALFGNLSKPTPPRLFNWDMAVHMADSSLFIPINYTDTLSVDNWLKMYTEMRYSAYDTLPMKVSDSIIYPCYNYGADTINMTTMFYDYYRFKPNAMTTNLYFDFDTINNTITDKAVRPGYPYDIFKVFASSPIKNIASRNQVIFRFGTENLFYDNFNKLDVNTYNLGKRIRVNFNEGTGWHELIAGQDNYFPIYFTDAGKYAIEVQVIQLKGETETELAHSISYLKIKKTRAGPNDDPNQTINNFGMNINVYEPCNSPDPQFTKTLIYLEGFDINDFSPNLNRTAQEVYEWQIIGSGLSDLRNFGYRILVVDWENSRIDMRDNAKHVNDLIEWLKCGNLVGDGNEEEFVIMGESMGGIVANYALMQQENGEYTSYCKPRKMHNTRLLITLDSPFEGAHIPMGMQHIAKWFRNHTLGNWALPIIPLATKIYLNANDMFLDGDAAKQLMMYHVSTQSPLGPATYSAHNQRDNFIQDQYNLGDHPKYCKLVSASNGNMLGLGQTRYWDGQDRIDGDYLLRNKSRFHGTILGHKVNLAGYELEMKTDPNGIGNLGKLNFGTWAIKVKVKWFGIKIYASFNSLCNKDWDGYMLPISNSAGGLLDFNAEINDNFIDGKDYQGSGEWTSISAHKWGTDATVNTDGFHWCFVPVSSAFDNQVLLNNPYDIMNMATVFNLLRPHVIYGVPGKTQNTQPSTLSFFWGRNPYIRNSSHTDVRNDTLRDDINIPTSFKWYPPNCPATGNNMPRVIRMLNREIGDDELSLECRYLPWEATCSIPDKISINVKSEYYNYPSVSPTTKTLRSIYSQEKVHYIIDNQGFQSFNTTTGNVSYNPPFSGPYAMPIFNFQPCCENYLKTPNNGNINNALVSNNEMTIFPNPTERNFVMKFVPTNTGTLEYKIIDLMGKVVYQKKVEIKEKNTNYFLPIQLPFALPLGQYIIHATNNEQLFSNKLIIQ
jgi:hypothetical protein